MVNTVKEGFQIQIYYPFLALLYFAPRLIYRLMRIAVRPESIAVGVKVRFPDRGQHLCNRLLDKPVYDRRYSQLALASVRFGDFYPFDDLRSVVTTQKLAFDLGPILLQVIR